MGKIPSVLRENIARNIRDNRLKKFPGRGGGKKCAEAFGVSPQQWSPWERGMRTPDELRLQQIAEFFGTTVEELRRDNSGRRPESYVAGKSEAVGMRYPGGVYAEYPGAPAPMLREADSATYRIPSFRRDEGGISTGGVADLAMASARLLGLVSATTKGVVEGKFESGKTITALRMLGDILEERLRDADLQANRPPQVY